MLKYSIRKPSKGIFMDAMDKLAERRQAQGSYPRPAILAPRKPDDRMANEFMTKLGFNQWFMEKVHNKYHTGELYTSNHVPVKPGLAPNYWFEITYLEETYATAKWHDYVKEPLVIHTEVMPRSKPRTYRKHCPATLRKLTEEEAQIVYLQNTAAQ